MPGPDDLIPSIVQVSQQIRPINPSPSPSSLAGAHPAVAVFFAFLHISAGIKAMLDG